MSCWRCNTPFKEGFEYCLECEASIQGYCIICYSAIRKLKVDYVHGLWDDMGYSGRPICDSCYFILIDKVPDKLDVPIKRIAPKKIGIEKWI